MNDQQNVLSEEIQEQIKRVTEELLSIAGLRDVAVELKSDLIDKTAFSLHIRSHEDVSYFIGRGGGILDSLQTILNAMYKKIGAQKFILVDVNDYRRDRIAYIKDTARKLARKVAQTKTEERMEPMPFYERKAIHIELASQPDVITESEGKGEERYVVIRPYIF